MKKMTKSNFKIRKSSLYLMIFVVLVMIPTGPLVLNISMGISEKSLNSSSVIYDIQINSPEAITYNNPMSGYYPALHGFEDKTNGDTPNNWDNWESDESVQVASVYSGHKKVLNLDRDSWVSNSFSSRKTGIIDFWICLPWITSTGYVFVKEGDNEKIGLKFQNNEIRYLIDNQGHYSYESIGTYENGDWKHLRIICIEVEVMSRIEYYWMLSIDGVKTSQYEYASSFSVFNRIQFESESFNVYIDALSYNWDTSYTFYEGLDEELMQHNKYEGIFVDFTCYTELTSMAYSIDNRPWRETNKEKFVIPWMGGGSHSIEISGWGIDGNEHYSQPRHFTIPELLGWGVDAINAEKVWGGTEDATDVNPNNPSGQGVNVLVIDSGIDINHPDLVANYKGGWDFVEPDEIPDDEDGHGTHCSGIIGTADNSVGILGVAPNVRLYATRASESATQVRDAVDWAINNDIDIISMSLGLGVGDLDVWCQDAYDAGITFVVAAGNGGIDGISYPATLDSTIAVGAITDSTGSYTRWGGSNYGDELDIMAPGEDIFSTMINSQYIYKTGTSMATPMVAGVCALILSNSDYYLNAISGPARVDAIREILINTASKVGGVSYENGWHQKYGYGMVNAEAAMDYAYLNIESPSQGASFYRGADITFKAYGIDSNGIDKVEYKVDSGSWYQASYQQSTDQYKWTWTTTGSYGNGLHTITCRLTDEDGNTITDSIQVQLTTAKEVAFRYINVLGTTISGNVQSTHSDDGNELRIRQQLTSSGGWGYRFWKSETDFRFYYSEYWYYETLQLQVRLTAGSARVYLYYSTGGSDDYAIYGTHTFSLSPYKPIRKIIIIHTYSAYFWPPAKDIFIDYIWIKHAV